MYVKLVKLCLLLGLTFVQRLIYFDSDILMLFNVILIRFWDNANASRYIPENGITYLP